MPKIHQSEASSSLLGSSLSSSPSSASNSTCDIASRRFARLTTCQHMAHAANGDRQCRVCCKLQVCYSHTACKFRCALTYANSDTHVQLGFYTKWPHPFPARFKLHCRLGISVHVHQQTMWQPISAASEQGPGVLPQVVFKATQTSWNHWKSFLRRAGASLHCITFFPSLRHMPLSGESFPLEERSFRVTLVRSREAGTHRAHAMTPLWGATAALQWCALAGF